MSSKREECTRMAKVCEHAERYEDMKAAMEDLIRSAGEPLEDEDRNLLSVAYKNVVGARRSSWRVMHAKESEETDENHKKLIRGYRGVIEKELNGYCDEVLDLLEQHLLPKSKDDAAQIFFLKMKGDYYRYKVEIAEGSERDGLAESSQAAYLAAMDKAKATLPPTHPIRLGLALNFSVFHYEIKNTPSEACKLAKEAFELAIGELDHVSEETYKDSTLIMQLLRDNLTLWTSELEAETEQTQE